MKVKKETICTGCRAILEWEPDELIAVIPGQVYRFFCPVCKATNTPNPAIVEYEAEREEETPEDDAPPDERIRKALVAQRALEETGTVTGAAANLGVSPQTVRNWLKNLPETVSEKA